jgi:raffinose/stachyose/melibiose transport system permease protein
MTRPSRATYLILTLWSLVVLGPIWILVVNSFKRQREIFSSPWRPPQQGTLEGYRSVLERGDFGVLFRNSILVTGVSILIVLFVGSMAGMALSQWRCRTSSLIYFGFVAGLMIPIRLATIDIVRMVERVGLIDNVWGLIPVYVAMSLPIAVFVLTAFVNELPHELFEAARIDGAGEWAMYRRLVLPLLRPAISTVVVLTALPIWNDVWFPLILTASADQQTLMLGVSRLFGQYTTDWTAILSMLTIAALPILLLYVALNRLVIRGLTSGAIKG